MKHKNTFRIILKKVIISSFFALLFVFAYQTEAANPITISSLTTAYKAYLTPRVATKIITPPIIVKTVLTQNGSQGPQGSSGLTGPEGPRGFQGPQGIAGPQGQSGGGNIDTSSFVSRAQFNNQISGILNSINSNGNNLSQSLANSFATNQLAVSGNATVGGGLNVTGQGTFTRIPTLPHVFSAWPTGTSNIADSTLYVNPTSSVADGNLIGAAVNGTVKFLVDAEGDVYANNLILTGSTTTGVTSIGGNLTVQDSTTLGDAPTDTLTINGTAVSIPNNLNFDSNTLFIDSLNHRVGIGTTAPTAKLHSLATTEQLRLGYDISNYTPFTVNSSGNLTVAPTGQFITLSSFLRIGSAGIPQDNLHIVGISPRIRIEDTNTSSTWKVGVGISNLSKFFVSDDTTGIIPLTIDSSGNVGIGTTGPRTALEVSGDLIVANGTNLNINNPAFGYGVSNATASGLAGGFNTIINGQLSDPVGTTANVVIGGSLAVTTTGSNSNTLVGPGSGTTITGASDHSTVLGTSTSISNSSHSTAVGFGAAITSSNNTIALGDLNAQIVLGGNFAPLGRLSIKGLGASSATYSLRIQNSSSTDLFAVRDDGNVGIGTTAPGQQLEITGNFKLPTTTATTGIIYSGTNPFIHNFGTANFFGGVSAGNLTLTGNTNVGVGFSALPALTSGNSNVAIGAAAMLSNTSGSTNTAVGRNALRLNTTANDNSAFGSGTLQNNIIGTGNTAIGFSALINGTSDFNTAVGRFALSAVANSGTLNTALGNAALFTITSGSQNTGIGASAGQNLTTGSHNIVIGYNTNAPSATASNQLDIGNLIYGTGIDGTGSIMSTGNIGIGTTTPAGRLDVSGSSSGTDSTLFVGARAISLINTDTTANNMSGFDFRTNDANALLTTGAKVMGVYTSHAANAVSGDLSFLTRNAGTITEKMRILSNGNVGIGTTSPGAPLEVKGSVTHATIAKFTDATDTTSCTLSSGGLIACSSDVRLKKNIEDITYGLNTVMGLRPVLYNWNYEGDGSTKSLGFIAQEVENLVPKLISTDDNGMKSLNTIGMIPILTKSIQELNLNLEGISGTITPLSGSANESFVTAFFKNLKTTIGTWLADAGNGISNIFATTITVHNANVDNLCVSDASGAKTCITKAQLDAMLSNAGTPNQPAGVTVQGSGSSSPAPTTTPPVTPAPEIPTCTAPQTLVNNVCTDPAPAPSPDPTSSTTPAPTPTPPEPPPEPAP